MIFFKKDKTNFYELLLRQARLVEEGMKALVEYMEDPTPAHAHAVLSLEEQADDARAVVAQELNKSFVTPIDPEDINALSRSVDDIIDYGKTTVEEMTAFGVLPNKHLLLMALGLSEGASALCEAIAVMAEDRDRANDRVMFAKKRENYVEHCYREALVELFKTDNVVMILKIREIYRHMSNAADRGDEAANVVGNILVKSM